MLTKAQQGRLVRLPPSSYVREVAIVAYLFLPVIGVAAIFDETLTFVALSAAGMAILGIPITRSGRVDLFSPWNWLFFWTFLTVFVRSLYIALDIPDAATIDYFFLRGESKSFLLWPTVTVIIGLLFTTFGYLAGPCRARRIPLRVFESDRWDYKRLRILVIVMLLLSWVGLYAYVVNTGTVITLGNLSATRTLASDLADYRAYGYLRWMVYLSEVACYILFAKALTTQRFRFGDAVFIILSGGTSLFFYFFVQTRSGIAAILLALVAIRYYLRDRRFPVKTAIILGVAALVALTTMTRLRPGSGFSPATPLEIVSLRAIEPLVVNTNGTDVSKTAHIMAAVGNELPRAWGKSLLNVFVIWIPRQLWPAKPVNVDTTVGMAVFGATTYGAGAVPPGLVAEMYWNFSFPGVLAGCFAVGYLMRFVYTQFLAYSGNRNIVLWYVISFMPFGTAFLGSSVSGAITSFVMASAPLLATIYLITDVQRPAVEKRIRQRRGRSLSLARAAIARSV